MAARRRTAAGIRCCRAGSIFAKRDVIARTCVTVGPAKYDPWVQQSTIRGSLVSPSDLAETAQTRYADGRLKSQPRSFGVSARKGWKRFLPQRHVKINRAGSEDNGYAGYGIGTKRE
jgi:hypothetical protein